MDALACHQAGINNTVAVLGTGLTAEQARLIKRYADSAILVFDSDQAGMRAARRGCEVLLKAGLEVKLAWLGEQKDPDDYIRINSAAAFEKLLEEALDPVEYFVRAAAIFEKSGNEKTVRSRVSTAQGLFSLIERFPSAMETQGELERLAQKLVLEPAAVKADFEEYQKGTLKPAPVFEPKNQGVEKKINIQPLLIAQKELIEFLARHPQWIEKAVERIPRPDFKDPVILKAAQIIWENMSIMGESDGTELYEQAENFLRESTLADYEKFGEPEKVLNQILAKIELEKIKKEKQKEENILLQTPTGETQRVLIKIQEMQKKIQECKKIISG
jgi:DNA primase